MFDIHSIFQIVSVADEIIPDEYLSLPGRKVKLFV